MEKGGAVTSGSSSQYAHKTRAAGQTLSVPPLCQELKAELNENVKSICAMIDSLSADELFKPHMRKWADDATKAAVWEVYRFIHVNTVAPFRTFRTKIRKWKKAVL